MSRLKRDEDEDSSYGWLAVLGLGAAALGYVAAANGVPKALNAVGFGSEGVRKDSKASKYQSENYGGNTPKGGYFSECQRTGEKGLSTTATLGVAASTAIAAAVLYKSCTSKKK